MLDTITAHKPRFISTFNIISVFWQTTIAKVSRELTTFTGPGGRRWRFKHAPFGLSCSSVHLILILRNLFCDKSRFHSLAVYMDDICCFSRHWDSHIKQLELTLSTLQMHGCFVTRGKLKLVFQRSKIWDIELVVIQFVSVINE